MAAVGRVWGAMAHLDIALKIAGHESRNRQSP